MTLVIIWVILIVIPVNFDCQGLAQMSSDQSMCFWLLLCSAAYTTLFSVISSPLWLSLSYLQSLANPACYSIKQPLVWLSSRGWLFFLFVWSGFLCFVVFLVLCLGFVFICKSKLGYFALFLCAGTVDKGCAVCQWKDYSFARLNILFILLRLLLETSTVAGQTIISAPPDCLLSHSVKCLYLITFNLWIFRSYSG